uniref:Uncharacterized protein n=1 Tax=Physcomitrium patens TaxID=3218 RepID=A0A2K1ISC6_PHYPA|nr:hypothetical protein PHYPA_026307 [Physcomitrium patens]
MCDTGMNAVAHLHKERKYLLLYSILTYKGLI